MAEEVDLPRATEVNDRSAFWPVAKLQQARRVIVNHVLVHAPAEAGSLPAGHLDVHTDDITPGVRIPRQERFDPWIAANEVVGLCYADRKVLVREGTVLKIADLE